MNEKRNDVYALTAVIVIWAALLINDFIWLEMDRCPLTYDAHRHFMFSLKVFKEYQHLSSETLNNILRMTHRHPPLVGMVVAPFYFLFGITQDAGTMINVAVFFTVLIFSVYAIGRRIGGGKAGVLSAFIVSVYPIIFNHMKTYNLDLPVTAMVALSFLLLLLSDNFSNFKYTVLFGISCSAGFLVKDSFPLYLIFPAALSLLSGLRSRKIALRRNILICLAIAALISLPYIFLRPRFIFEKLLFGEYHTFYPVPGELPHIYEKAVILYKWMKSILWYLWGLVNWQLGMFFFVILIIGFFHFLRQSIKDKALLISALYGFIIVALSKGAYGDHMTWLGVRFTMPVLPFLAVISASGIISMEHKKARRIVIGFIVTAGLAQFFAVSYGTKLLPQEISLPVKSVLPGEIGRYYLFPEKIIIFQQVMPAYGGPLSRPNMETPEKIRIPQEIFRLIDSNNGAGRKKINILVIPDISRIWAYLQYESYILDRPYDILGDWIYWDLKKREGRIEDHILDCDYVVDKKEGESGEFYLRWKVKAIGDSFKQYKDKFDLIGQFRWPDDADIYIYKRKKRE